MSWGFEAGRARFLFGPEVYDYLRGVRSHLVNLITKGGALPDMPNGAQRTKAEDELTADLFTQSLLTSSRAVR
jgi:hypothetical protein